jgi:hypothetical protein
MSWSNFLQAVAKAYTSSPSTGGSGTPSDPAAPPPASAPGSGGAAGGKRKVKWAPDFSTFIFEDEYPGAVWQGSRAVDPWEASSPVAPAGFYTPDQQVFGPDGAYNAGGNSIAPFQGEWDPWSGGYIGRTDPYWSDFERAGLLDLTPGSDLWKHLQSKPGVARYGDVMSDPMAHFTALQSLYSMSPYASFRQGGKIYRARHNDYVGVRDDLIARGYDPKTAQAIASGMDQYAEAASRSDDDMFKLEDITKDIVGGLGQILQVPPIRAAMLAMSLGGSGLFGELGAAGGAAGELGQDFLAEELLAGAPELAGAFSLDATTGLAGAMPTGMLGETPAADYDWLSDKAANTTLATRAVADPALAGIPIDAGYLDLAPEATAGATQEPDLLDQVKETYDTVSKYGKVIKEVESILGSAVPDGAPARREGQDDAAYSADLAEYMNLDAGAMAEMGLQPGSPEYMQYIMQQADAIIEQVLEGVDVNADDISAQLRSKTADEMAQLQRALYVRGTLDQMMGSGTYTDPFSGTDQEVISTGGMLNPHVGAYQRGLAGSFQNISRSDDPLTDINALLGRSADLFGMQGRADERFERAKLEDDIRRRRGMLGM